MNEYTISLKEMLTPHNRSLSHISNVCQKPETGLTQKKEYSLNRYAIPNFDSAYIREVRKNIFALVQHQLQQ